MPVSRVRFALETACCTKYQQGEISLEAGVQSPSAKRGTRESVMNTGISFILPVLVHGRRGGLFDMRWYKGKKKISGLNFFSLCKSVHPKFPLPFIQLDAKAASIWPHPARLHVLGGGGTSNNLDQLASNDGLSGTVEKNLVLVDHLTGVLGGVLRGFWISTLYMREAAENHVRDFRGYLRPWHSDGQRFRKRGPQPGPRRWRWRARFPAGWAGAPRRPRKPRSFLQSHVRRYVTQHRTNQRRKGQNEGV